MTCHCDPNLASVRRDSDAIEATITERSAVGEPHTTHGYDCAILPHADNRVVSAVGHIEVSPFFESGIAGPVWVFGLDLSRSQVNRFLQRFRLDATDRSHAEDHTVVNQVDGRDRILKRLADKEGSHRRVVEDHTESR